MNLLITGGTGLIGYALQESLFRQQHRSTIVTRFPEKAAPRFQKGTHIFRSVAEIPASHRIDAVVNLAGAQIVGKRWTRARKQMIWNSRVEFTQQLVRWLSERRQKPEALINGSAIGFYGDCGEQAVDEHHGVGQDFGAQLCSAWETEAKKAESLGIRVCLARTGLVLSNRGGMLQQMLLPFRMGLGSKIGSGRQWMSWIHISDQIAALELLLNDRNLSGPFNLTAPGAVTNDAFTSTLARVIHRPRFFTAPQFAIRTALGEASELLLGGQRVAPQRLLECGYRFQFSSLEPALRALLESDRAY